MKLCCFFFSLVLFFSGLDQKPFRQQLADVTDSATRLIGLSLSPGTQGSICPVVSTVKRKLCRKREKKKTTTNNTHQYECFFFFGPKENKGASFKSLSVLKDQRLCKLQCFSTSPPTYGVKTWFCVWLTGRDSFSTHMFLCYIWTRHCPQTPCLDFHKSKSPGGHDSSMLCAPCFPHSRNSH